MPDTPIAINVPADSLLTVDGLAAYLNTTTRHIRALRERGEGPVCLRVGRLIRYRRSDVDAWLAGCVVGNGNR